MVDQKDVGSGVKKWNNDVLMKHKNNNLREK